MTAAQARLKGVLTIDYVVPDYHGVRPKACMSGWARRFLNVTPSGTAVPCHAAETLPGIDFPSVRDSSLADIWYRSDAFNRFRGTEWMPEPCQSCDRREIDWGGCRCQAFLLAGDASRADPVCALSPDHGLVTAALEQAEGGRAGFGLSPVPVAMGPSQDDDVLARQAEIQEPIIVGVFQPRADALLGRIVAGPHKAAHEARSRA